MFKGKVVLVNRNGRTVHAGIKINGVIVSACNLTWDIRDKLSEGEQKEVTCKRCQKLLKQADENGVVTLKPKRRR